jgi:hypothetical protein
LTGLGGTEFLTLSNLISHGFEHHASKNLDIHLDSLFMFVPSMRCTEFRNSEWTYECTRLTGMATLIVYIYIIVWIPVEANKQTFRPLEKNALKLYSWISFQGNIIERYRKHIKQRKKHKMVYQCLSWCIHLYLLNSLLLTQKKLNKPSGVCPFETLTRRESISTSARWFCMASAWVKWPRCWEGLSNTSKKVSIQSDQTNVKRMLSYLKLDKLQATNSTPPPSATLWAPSWPRADSNIIQHPRRFLSSSTLFQKTQILIIFTEMMEMFRIV